MIVLVAAFSRVNPNVVAFSLVLGESLAHVLFVPQLGGTAHRINHGLLFRICGHAIQELMKLQLSTLRILRLNLSSLDSSRQPSLCRCSCLRFRVHALHSVLDFVHRLLFSVEAFDAHKVESVHNKG